MKMNKFTTLLATLALSFGNAYAISPIINQADEAEETNGGRIEYLRYGNFDTWLVRNIKESGIIGGHTKTLVEIGPNAVWNNANAYHGIGGTPWATSNVLARVAGITKTNTSVFRDVHPGHGYCAKLYTHIEKCVVLGMVNIKVLAAGSIYLGQTQEPITNTSNPMAKLNAGIRFNRRPKALIFDYKAAISGHPNRVRQTGFGSASTVGGRDMADCVLLLQKRWEDRNGNIYAHRVGTMVVRFDRSTGWKNNCRMPIYYGNITHQSYYRPYMGLISSGAGMKYAKNSRGQMVPVHEVAWGAANETPTHIILQFDSSHGGAYVGSVGNTLWVDNVRLEF